MHSSFFPRSARVWMRWQRQRPRASPTASASPGPDAKSGLWFEPKALSSCETEALVKVHWNVSAMEGVKTVNVFTVRPGGQEASSRHARPTGMKRTGRWIRAGREFVVRDADRGADLARAAVGTLPCPAGSNSRALKGPEQMVAIPFAACRTSRAPGESIGSGARIAHGTEAMSSNHPGRTSSAPRMLSNWSSVIGAAWWPRDLRGRI